MTNGTKCYVGLSGGVDSSVAAYLLKQKEREVHGVYANCFSSEADCRNSQDHVDAVKVAGQLGIRLETKDYRGVYSERVLESFYSDYDKGRTPNPDILCNSEVKFGVMASDIFAESPDACLATGHYVGNVCFDRSQFELLLAGISGDKDSIERVTGLLYGGSVTALNFMLSALDASKDQSYFLYKLYDKSERLSRYIFPLSEMTKRVVRGIASDAGLCIANKPDSQGICFIGNIKLADFIKEHVKARQGEVVNMKGELIGTHSGIQFYTIGQRHGFKVKTYSGSPLYIVGKIPDENILIVGNRPDALMSEFVVSDFYFPYGIEKFLEEFNNLSLSVRVRNLGKKIPCKVKVTSVSDSVEIGKRLSVRLSVPEFGIAPGQSAVFYLGRLMLGGGIIDSTDFQADFPYKK